MEQQWNNTDGKKLKISKKTNPTWTILCELMPP
jgi:hypothetical protein